MEVTRKKLIFGGLTSAAFVLAGSVAFACLIPKGQVTVSNAGSSVTVKATDIPTHATFCGGMPTTAAIAATGTQVNVAVAPSTCVSTNTQLSDGSADVVLQYSNTNPGWVFSNGAGTWNWQTSNGCFGPNAPITATLGSFTISSGSASGNFTIPATANLSDNKEAGHICVRSSVSTGDGAFAPIRIV